jgi:hypothetical protein
MNVSPPSPVMSRAAWSLVSTLVSLASRREDHRAWLSREAPDRTTNAARYLTGLYVRRPGDYERRGRRARGKRELLDRNDGGA